MVIKCKIKKNVDYIIIAGLSRSGPIPLWPNRSESIKKNAEGPEGEIMFAVLALPFLKLFSVSRDPKHGPCSVSLLELNIEPCRK